MMIASAVIYWITITITCMVSMAASFDTNLSDHGMSFSEHLLTNKQFKGSVNTDNLPINILTYSNHAFNFHQITSHNNQFNKCYIANTTDAPIQFVAHSQIDTVSTDVALNIYKGSATLHIFVIMDLGYINEEQTFWNFTMDLNFTYAFVSEFRKISFKHLLTKQYIIDKSRDYGEISLNYDPNKTAYIYAHGLFEQKYPIDWGWFAMKSVGGIEQLIAVSVDVFWEVMNNHMSHVHTSEIDSVLERASRVFEILDMFEITKL
eukprot:32216_1